MTAITGKRGAIRLGLRENWEQFALLILVNAFVGGMVGVERVVLPLLAEQEFGLASKAAILSFIASFGLAKAAANLLAGRMSDVFGRKRILLAGWLIGLPVPLLIWVAPSWIWVALANMLLGINQGLCWSTTVIMKIDLVGPARRGLAMGLNEASGYLAVSAAALGSGYFAASYGLREGPVYLGFGLAVAGLLLSALFVSESQGHASYESELAQMNGQHRTIPLGKQSLFDIFTLASWRNRTLFGVSQAGLVNNLNDGMAWGLLPIYFAAAGLSLQKVSLLAASYPAVWGLAQLATGALSDRIGRKPLIVNGMWVQAAAIFLIVAGRGFQAWFLGVILLGLGTAMVYPTLLAAIGDVAGPEWRASAVGVYRLWRDSGYVLGAVFAGFAADLLGEGWAIAGVAALTALSGLAAAVAIRETLPAAAEGHRRR
jgi:MFS family permease